MKTEFFINKKGQLIRYKFNDKKQIYTKHNYTNKMINFLHYPCSIEEGATLKSIFILMYSKIDLLDSLIGNWAKEFVQEGLKITKNDHIINSDDEMEFLELYWFVSNQKSWDYLNNDFCDKNDQETVGFNFPNFHGVGVCKKNDYFYKIGDRIDYSLSLSPVSELINYPIKINTKYTIFDDITQTSLYSSNKQVTLFEIFYGIIYELSFHGNPESKLKMKDQLNEITTKIRSQKKAKKVQKKTKKLKKPI